MQSEALTINQPVGFGTTPFPLLANYVYIRALPFGYTIGYLFNIQSNP